MSIVALDRVTLIGRQQDGARLLDGLQSLGVVHLDVLEGDGGDPEAAIDARIRTAYRWLSRTRIQRHRQRSANGFDARALVDRAEAIRDELKGLGDRRLALLKRIEAVRPWGNFVFRSLADHPELRLWFYEVPVSRIEAFERSDFIWGEVGRDARAAHLVIVAAEEPQSLPVARIHVGERSLDELEAELNAVEVRIDDLQAERASLTRWLDQFRQTIDCLVDQSLHGEAASALAVEGPLLIAHGWLPRHRGGELRRFADDQGAVLAIRKPTADDEPPTLLRNPPLAAPGEALVRFFTTPGYRSWDPAGLVLASFVIFFAIIISDAIYGMVLALMLMLAWNSLGRTRQGRQWRIAGAFGVAATTLWGMLVGSYAGTPPPLPLLERIHVIPASDHRFMLAVSIGIGIVHLILANVIAAWMQWPERTAWARMGWVMLFVAAPLWQSGILAKATWAPLVLAGLGLALVLLYSSPSPGLLPRLGGGALALTRLVGALGDTLSYLRLFALAIAGTSLAAAFNDLAAQSRAVPGVGVLFALIVLSFGHGMNLALGIASGVVHGLRLNYIEFFGWGLWGEGRPFRAFARREKSS